MISRLIQLIYISFVLISVVGCGPARKVSDAHLIKAACQGHVDKVQALITLGADVNARADRSTALTAAESCGQPNGEAIVKILLESGAKVNVQDSEGGTALIYAARNGHVESIKALIAKGADVNLKDKEGLTALMQAARVPCKIEPLELLVKAGADVNARSKKGWSVLDYAKQSCACPEGDRVQWLIRNGAR